MTEDLPAPPARIERIEVKGLFGLYDHVIDLKLADRVTILHGPNGVGKTVLFRMLRALLAGALQEIAQFPFTSFRVVFTTQESIEIEAFVEETPADKQRRTRGRVARHLKIRQGGAVHETVFVKRTVFPDLELLAGSTAAGDERGARRRLFPAVQWEFDRGPEILPLPIDHISAHLIEAQRMLRHVEVEEEFGEPARSQTFPSVWADALDLRGRIDASLRTYGRVTQDLDQTFPTRLLQRTGQSVALPELKARMAELERTRAQLQQFGLLDEQRAKPFDLSALDTLTSAQSDVMALYIEDNQKKLSIFVDLAERIGLLLRIINSRFRNKTLQAHPQQGLVASDHRGTGLELRALSSGEQHQIVLLYALLFRVRAGDLVLIDEPELSLHVLWQKRFVPELLEVVKVAGIDAIVATHSPFIVGERSDLMVALDAEIEHDEPVRA